MVADGWLQGWPLVVLARHAKPWPAKTQRGLTDMQAIKSPQGRRSPSHLAVWFYISPSPALEAWIQSTHCLPSLFWVTYCWCMLLFVSIFRKVGGFLVIFLQACFYDLFYDTFLSQKWAAHI